MCSCIVLQPITSRFENVQSLFMSAFVCVQSKATSDHVTFYYPKCIESGGNGAYEGFKEKKYYEVKKDPQNWPNHLAKYQISFISKNFIRCK